MDLLRFSTAGSVDDGKSTLIGRLLFDSKGVFEDQLEAVKRSTVNRSAGPIDLSLLTDGLRAEREQGITIDVAYRYFATPKRKFIIADTPGHEQYTRNMATGASTAQLAIVLIDARYGALVQSRRHTFIAALLGIPHVVVAVNKMDLVGWSQERFEEIRKDFEQFIGKVGIANAQFIPLSALLGDNVVDPSGNMPWYAGPTLLHHLETVDASAAENMQALRFPVQYVVRPDLDFRGFAGQIAAGGVRVGDAVKALPAGLTSRVKRIYTLDGDLPHAFAPQSVALLLEDEIDISRGDMLVHAGQEPWVRREFDADVVWMDAAPLQLDRQYLVKHAARTVRAKIGQLHCRVDVNTLEEKPADSLQLNEIGKVRVACAQPLFVDPYRDFRRTGCFVLIDPLTNATVGAGMVAAQQQPEQQAQDKISRVNRAARAAQLGHQAAAIFVEAADRELQQAVVFGLEARLFQRGVAAVAVPPETPPSAGDPAAALGWLVGRLVDAGQIALVGGSPAVMGQGAAEAMRGRGDLLAFRLGGDAAAEGAVPLDDSGADGAIRRILLAMADRGLFGAPTVVSPGAGI